MENQQGPAGQHRGLCSVSGGSLEGRGVWVSMDTCVCLAESLCCPPKTIIIYLIGYTPIPVELFQILEDDAVQVLHSICQQTWKTQLWPQDWRRAVFMPIPNKGDAKECSNYRTTALISHVSKVMLKILQARLQQCMNRELPDVQAGSIKGRGTRDQIANIRWIIRKARKFQKIIYFCCIDYAKAFDCVENSKRDGNTRPPDLPPEKPVCRSRSNS